MMKNIFKALLFIALFSFSLHILNGIVIDKSYNRYYMMEKDFEQHNEEFDVLVYGSCHAYTSFNCVTFNYLSDLNAYNLANPSEIIPVTYLRMLNQFKNYTPKVVLVETWGINAYETYIDTNSILTSYLNPNIELLPFSREKIEVINDFSTLDIINDNIPLARYKDRIVNGTLVYTDFNYSFEKHKNIFSDNNTNFIIKQTDVRQKYNGFYPQATNNMSNYPELQNYVNCDEYLAIEENIFKYIEKIIELCEKNNVKLIFYRSPYISSKNELMKANYLEKYLTDNGVYYYDLEKELTFNYTTDFSDEYHLSNQGSKKATSFLSDKIMEIIN